MIPMNLPYIIQVQICIALFWLAYRMFMRGNGMFGQTRIYLLGSVVVSFVVPALSIPAWSVQATGGTVQVGDLDWNWVLLLAEEETTQTLGWPDIARLAAGVGTVVMAFGVCRHVFRMARSVKRSDVRRIEKARLVCDKQIHAPYSFFRYIFINADHNREELPQVVAHEMAHIRLGHSYDSVFIQLMLVLFWWNPFVWLWSRSLKEVHEYQADAAVLQQGYDSKRYITLLIGTLADIHPEFVSGFSYSLIKNRLLMMTKKAGRFAKWRILAALPVLGITLLLFSFTEKPLPVVAEAPVAGVVPVEIPIPAQPETLTVRETPRTTSPQPAATQPDVAPPPADDEPFLMVDTMPLFEGGEHTTFRTWILQQLKYPAEAVSRSIQGRVTVSFIIEKDGSLSNVNILSSPDKSLSDEVVRIVSLSPKWTPGKQQGENVRVRFTLPVEFALSGGKTSDTSSSSSSLQIGDGKPTFMVNGKLHISGASTIDPHTIHSITVHKANPDYPNGLVEIALKDGVEPNTLNEVVVLAYGNSDARTATQSTAGLVVPSEILIIIDGKTSTIGEFRALLPDDIASMDIRKDESSRQYGEAGKNGVIIVKTKRN